MSEEDSLGPLRKQVEEKILDARNEYPVGRIYSNTSNKDFYMWVKKEKDRVEQIPGNGTRIIIGTSSSNMIDEPNPIILILPIDVKMLSSEPFCEYISTLLVSDMTRSEMHYVATDFLSQSKKCVNLNKFDKDSFGEVLQWFQEDRQYPDTILVSRDIAASLWKDPNILIRNPNFTNWWPHSKRDFMGLLREFAVHSAMTLEHSIAIIYEKRETVAQSTPISIAYRDRKLVVSYDFKAWVSNVYALANLSIQ